MPGQYYGLRLSGEGGLTECAAEARERLTELFKAGTVYSQFLYPYFDSLLMSGAADEFGLLFGTHSLIWDEDERLADCGLVPIAPDCRAIAAFLAEDVCTPREGEVLLGGVSELIAGDIRPWAIREHSRRFCSFCEHIARMKGVRLIGLTGGYVAIRLEQDELLGQITDIYHAKTSGCCRVLRPGAAVTEER